MVREHVISAYRTIIGIDRLIADLLAPTAMRHSPANYPVPLPPQNWRLYALYAADVFIARLEKDEAKDSDARDSSENQVIQQILQCR